MLELANAFSEMPARTKIPGFLDALEHDSKTTLREPTFAEFQQGLELYRQRPDKGWSLTDCISFHVMRELGIQTALTGDHHFAQAGFDVVF